MTILVLVGILAATALPRIGNSSEFSSRAFRDAVWAAVTHARRAAIASRHFSCVVITANATIITQRIPADPDTLATVINNDCVSQAAQTLGTAIAVPKTLALNPTTLIFSPQGQLVSTASDATIAIPGQPGITVLAQTGFVQ